MTEAKELDPVALEAAVDYVLRYGGRCRDCADEAGICPHSGLACDPDDAGKVIRYVLRAAEYGRANGYLEARCEKLAALLSDELNVTDEELLRIRNRCEGIDGDALIWSRLLQKIVDAVRAARTALKATS